MMFIRCRFGAISTTAPQRHHNDNGEKNLTLITTPHVPQNENMGLVENQQSVA